MKRKIEWQKKRGWEKWAAYWKSRGQSEESQRQNSILKGKRIVIMWLSKRRFFVTNKKNLFYYLNPEICKPDIKTQLWIISRRAIETQSGHFVSCLLGEAILKYAWQGRYQTDTMWSKSDSSVEYKWQSIFCRIVKWYVWRGITVVPRWTLSPHSKTIFVFDWEPFCVESACRPCARTG